MTTQGAASRGVDHRAPRSEIRFFQTPTTAAWPFYIVVLHIVAGPQGALEPLQAGHDAPNASIPLGIAEGADKNIRATVASYSNPGQIGEIVPHK